MTREKLLAVALTVVMVVSVFGGTVLLTGPSAAAGTSEPRFSIIGAGNSGGDLAVTIKANTSEPARNFKFWYHDLDGGGTKGPTQFGDGNFDEAYYGTPMNKGPSYTAGTDISGGTAVTFVFDSGSTPYKYETDSYRVNATAFDKSDSSADSANRSVLTGNYYQIDVQDHANSPLSNVPVMIYNASTNATEGTKFLTSGSMTLDCRGVDQGGTCTNPDTDSAAALADGGKVYEAPISVETFSLAGANASGKVEPSSGATTLTADTPTAPTFLRLASLTQGGATPTAESLQITNAASGNVVFQVSDVSGELQAPVFLRPNTEYTVTIQNSSTFGTENRSLTLPTKGMSAVSMRIATTNVETATVTGQVVNESGDPVSGAVVIAQPEFASGSHIDIYNSSTTDSSGIFTMRLPKTDQLQSDFSFRMIGTETDGGTPIYYPTTDANDGDGYIVQSDQTVLPAMTIKKGGRVDIDVTTGNSQLPVDVGFTSLSQVSTAYPDTERTAASNSFSQFSFEQRPKSAAVSLMSPTTGSQTQVAYNVWGLPGNPSKHVCAGTPSVSQGSSTSSTCTLDKAGMLNISLQQYDSIVSQSTSSDKNVQEQGFLFQNELLVRDASTGDVVTYLGPGGIQQVFRGTNGSSSYVQIPVPAGNYNLELRPAYEFAPATSVNDTSTVSVTAGGSKQVQLDRGGAFRMRPSFSRATRSFTRDGANTMAFYVMDPADGSPLTGSDVSVQAQFLYANGTTASDPIPLSYNSTDKTFDTTTFTPSSHSIDAGRYSLELRTTYNEGTRSYNTTVSFPVQVSGFQTGVRLSTGSAAPGDTIDGQIYAYDTTTDPDSPIDASSASQTTITMYDQNGQQVSQKNPSSGFTGGQGSFSLTMPSEPGRYRVAVKIVADDSSQGIAERWVRVNKIDLDVETDRDTYAPSDTVSVGIEATDSSDDSAIQGASLTLRVNGQRKTATTDSNGKATVDLDPSTYGSGGQWSQGHGIGVTLAHESGGSIIRKTTGTGFEVQAFDARARPTASSFTTTEAATIAVQVPTTVSVSSVAVTTLDGEQVSIGGDPDTASAVSSPADGIYEIDLGQRPVGDHVATVTVKNAGATKQTARTQFAVKQFSVSPSLKKRSYETGESITVDVSLRKPDGTAVSGQQVNATLRSTSPDRAVDTAKASTGSNGDVSLSVSSSQSGFHVVEIEAAGQTRYAGISVNSVSARLEDSSGNPVTTYTAEPGTSQTIYINATKSDGSDVADDSRVRAGISAYGKPIQLGTAKTTNGDASITFTIPDTVPAREYPLIVEVSTDASGSGATTGTLDVSGASAKQLTATTNESGFAPGGTARLSATVTTGDGSPVSNEAVDFVIESDGAADQRVATVQTNSDGEATTPYAIPSGASNGAYVLRAELNETSSIRDYSGFRVRGLDVSVTAEDGPFEPGDTVDLTVEAVDSSTGNAIDATGGTVTLLLPGSNVETSLSPSGTGPYETSVTLPDDGSITGTRSISVSVEKDRATDSDSTLINVRDSSESATLSISEPVTAGQATTVTVGGTVDTTGVLTAYSPGAGSVAYNKSVSVSSSSDTDKQMTIGASGTHIVRLSVPGVGVLTEVIDVKPASGNPTVWAGPSTSENASEFTTGEDIYIKSNTAGMTATVVSPDSRYTVELDQQSGATHYGVLSTDRPEDIYLVRLDSSSATGVDDTIVEVNE